MHTVAKELTGAYGSKLALRIREVYMHVQILFDFSLTVKAAPHECVIRTGQPQT